MPIVEVACKVCGARQETLLGGGVCAEAEALPSCDECGGETAQTFAPRVPAKVRHEMGPGETAFHLANKKMFEERPELLERSAWPKKRPKQFDPELPKTVF